MLRNPPDAQIATENTRMGQFWVNLCTFRWYPTTHFSKGEGGQKENARAPLHVPVVKYEKVCSMFSPDSGVDKNAITKRSSSSSFGALTPAAADVLCVCVG